MTVWGISLRKVTDFRSDFGSKFGISKGLIELHTVYAVI